jgi:hypothetical protein
VVNENIGEIEMRISKRRFKRAIKKAYKKGKRRGYRSGGKRVRRLSTVPGKAGIRL